MSLLGPSPSGGCCCALFIPYKNKDLLEASLSGNQFCWKLKNGLLNLKMTSFEAVGKHSLEFSDSYLDVDYIYIIYPYSIVTSVGLFQPHFIKEDIFKYLLLLL